MVTETTNILLAGIISGWLLAGTQPIVNFIHKWISAKRNILTKIASYIMVYIVWLIALMAFIVYVYK